MTAAAPRAPAAKSKTRTVLCTHNPYLCTCGLVPTWWCTSLPSPQPTGAAASLLPGGVLMNEWCPPSRLDDRTPTARGWAQLKIPQPPSIETKVMHEEQPQTHETVYRCVLPEEVSLLGSSSSSRARPCTSCYAAQSTRCRVRPGASRFDATTTTLHGQATALVARYDLTDEISGGTGHRGAVI